MCKDKGVDAKSRTSKSTIKDVKWKWLKKKKMKCKQRSEINTCQVPNEGRFSSFGSCKANHRTAQPHYRKPCSPCHHCHSFRHTPRRIQMQLKTRKLTTLCMAKLVGTNSGVLFNMVMITFGNRKNWLFSAVHQSTWLLRQ